MQKQIVFRSNMFFCSTRNSNKLFTNKLCMSVSLLKILKYTNLKTKHRSHSEKKTWCIRNSLSRFEIWISDLVFSNLEWAFWAFVYDLFQFKWREWHVIVNWDFTKRMFLFYLCIFGKPNTHTCLDYRKKIKLIAFIKKKVLIIKKRSKWLKKSLKGNFQSENYFFFSFYCFSSFIEKTRKRLLHWSLFSKKIFLNEVLNISE